MRTFKLIAHIDLRRSAGRLRPRLGVVTDGHAAGTHPRRALLQAHT
jgi:hypothetical protein